MPRVNVKRIYEPTSKSDGFRVLVDRIWPRGVAKQRAKIDLWLKSVAPSTELRKWFAHDPAKADGFSQRYHKELAENPGKVSELIAHVQKGTVTLVYAARLQQMNNAVALRQYLLKQNA